MREIVEFVCCETACQPVARVGAGIAPPEVMRVGYIGSYARGDWEFGNDRDMPLILAQESPLSEQRAVVWDTTSLPIPVDLLVAGR